ncbi:MAG: DUF2164 domain-containing protein [Epsilonproteobacteria bacterium]|nr:DUF2164 domain-containing protein [Campylobacterota bacterium]OIO16776.1 MAG: hypothetical protein AUJ81_03560 [Helicobacteraceae bacterium CG1_02_36_14]PIP10069.1 MAG: hypothetical protein COX50_07785 [Sulfurimonas sp. CG23_combo_of_CG06-09_8_20_14_all_36_33]PIS23665.1 MAG: DUF2164 domain-containing protein [Sulfurimonas sp. CG08_land_8_20_14_0_20_36_33]PIU34832.1 MAG: DUF2164 domain-containing protein [Sulfurimonas sp. CG07_land_8_20_14_0_80_36_56]PIV05120.1 MAG: DUF2164 domain-containing
MADIKFSKEETENIVYKIKQYFQNELQSDIGQFEAEFLLDFFAKEIGNHFYNEGVRDAQAVVSTQFDNITQSLYEIEKITDLKK